MAHLIQETNRKLIPLIVLEIVSSVICSIMTETSYLLSPRSAYSLTSSLCSRSCRQRRRIRVRTTPGPGPVCRIPADRAGVGERAAGDVSGSRDEERNQQLLLCCGKRCVESTIFMIKFLSPMNKSAALLNRWLGASGPRWGVGLFFRSVSAVSES